MLKYLAECVTSIDAEKQVISTHGKQVLSIMPISRDNIGRLAPCNHDEANARMLLHAADAVQCGFTKILLRTVDTDVLILAIAFVEKLQEFQGNQTIELWVGFGAGAHLRYIAFHDISSKLKPQVPKALPSRGATPCPVFVGKSRRQQWTHGSLFLR